MSDIPREFVFMDRAAIGLGGAFLHLDARLNFCRMFNEALGEGFDVEEMAAGQRAALERADSLRGVAFLEFARKLVGDGPDAPVVEVPLAGLSQGDRVEVRSGELVPVDGVVLSGRSSLDNAVKTTVFLQDMNDFAKMNAVYAEFFKAPNPARAAVQVARLPRDVKVEIEAIALVK